MLVVHVDSTHGDAVDAVGVAVEIAVVVARSAVASREDVDGALAPTALLNSSHHGLLNEYARRLHGPAVIWRTPRARVDVVLLHFVVDCQGFVEVCNLSRKDAHTRDFRIVC